MIPVRSYSVRLKKKNREAAASLRRRRTRADGSDIGTKSASAPTVSPGSKSSLLDISEPATSNSTPAKVGFSLSPTVPRRTLSATNYKKTPKSSLKKERSASIAVVPSSTKSSSELGLGLSSNFLTVPSRAASGEGGFDSSEDVQELEVDLEELILESQQLTSNLLELDDGGTQPANQQTAIDSSCSRSRNVLELDEVDENDDRKQLRSDLGRDASSSKSSTRPPSPAPPDVSNYASNVLSGHHEVARGHFEDYDPLEQFETRFRRPSRAQIEFANVHRTPLELFEAQLSSHVVSFAPEVEYMPTPLRPDR